MTASTHAQDEFDDALGRDIAQALAPFRPDPESFDAAVQRKLDEAPDERRADMRPTPAWIQQAACFLPPMLLPKALAPLAAKGVKGAGWKFLPGWLALPVITLLMALMAFGFGLRQRFDGVQLDDRRQAREVEKDWWLSHWRPALAMLGLMIASMFWRPVDVAMVFVTLSMVALVGITGALARAGQATRATVALRIAQWLFMMAIYGISWTGLLQRFEPTLVGLSWIAPILLTAAFVLACIAGPTATLEQTAQRVLQLCASGIIVGVFLTMFLVNGGMPGFLREPADIADVRRYVTTQAGEPGDGMALIVEHLRAAGESDLDLTTYTTTLHEAFDATYAEGEALNNLMVFEQERAGFFREADYLARRSEVREWWVRSDTAIGGESSMSDLAAVLRTDDLDDAQRDRYAERLVLGLAKARLSDLVHAISLLEDLDRPARVADLEPLVMTTLETFWIQLPGESWGCFVPFESSPDRDERGRVVDLHRGPTWLEATGDAIDLMQRFGVPDSVDLAALRAYLQSQCLPGFSNDSRAFTAVAILHHLESMPAGEAAFAQARAAKLTEAMRYRVLAATLLLAVFGILTALRVPRPSRLSADPA